MAARSTISEIADLLAPSGSQSMSNLVEAYQARLQMLTGQAEVAIQWAESFTAQPQSAVGDFERLCAARILQMAGRDDLFLNLTHQLLDAALKKGRKPTAIEAMILLANDEIAHHHTPAALEWLEKAVQLAAPQHQARPFVSEGKAVWNLLPRVQPAAPQFVGYLVQITNTAQQAQEKQTNTLLDQLSEQELRVLKLIASGKSNQEIAGELVISVGTAKWHVHNVLQKLGVSNRAQAIVRARELGL